MGLVGKKKMSSEELDLQVFDSRKNNLTGCTGVGSSAFRAILIGSAWTGRCRTRREEDQGLICMKKLGMATPKQANKQNPKAKTTKTFAKCLILF